MELIELTNSASVMKSDNNSAALITFQLDRPKDIGEVKPFTAYEAKGKQTNYIKYWGSDNKLPDYREQVLMDNNIMGSLIESKASIVISNGVSAYVEMYEGEGIKGKRVNIPVPMPTEIETWMERHDIMDQYLTPAAYSLIAHRNLFVSFMPTKNKKDLKIGSIKTYPAKYIRAAKKKNEPVVGYLHHSNWLKPTVQESKFTWFPIYNRDAPSNSVAQIMHLGYGPWNDGVYWHPPYWGGKEWIELSNEIPRFHKSNLLNGYTVRVHIEIPAGYFMDKIAYRSARDSGDEKKIKKCIDKETKKRQQFLNEVNGVLSGVDNTGRTVITTKQWNDISKEWEGITITPINLDLKDDALLTLFDKSNAANISSMDIHPSIANVESQGKLSSGSEMKNSININVKYKTPVIRRILLKPILEVMRRNGWDQLKDPATGLPIKLRFEDIFLETTDKAPTGVDTPAEEG